MLQWVKNFSVYKKSGTRWSSLMIFVYQTLMASQMAVGANTVRPFRLQSHLRYPHNVRRNNSQHCLLLFIREKSKLSRFDIGLSRVPAPTILKLRQVLSNGRPQVAPTVVLGRLLCRKIAALFADVTLCRRIEKRCRFCSPIQLFIKLRRCNSSFSLCTA